MDKLFEHKNINTLLKTGIFRWREWIPRDKSETAEFAIDGVNCALHFLHCTCKRVLKIKPFKFELKFPKITSSIEKKYHFMYLWAWRVIMKPTVTNPVTHAPAFWGPKKSIPTKTPASNRQSSSFIIKSLRLMEITFYHSNIHPQSKNSICSRDRSS